MDFGRCAIVRFFRAAAAAFLILRRAADFCLALDIFFSLAMFIELNGSLVRLRLLPAGESAKIATLAGFGIFLARIKAVFTGLELANHWLYLRGFIVTKDARM